MARYRFAFLMMRVTALITSAGNVYELADDLLTQTFADPSMTPTRQCSWAFHLLIYDASEPAFEIHALLVT